MIDIIIIVMLLLSFIILGNLNCAAFMAGVVEAFLSGSDFVSV